MEIQKILFPEVGRCTEKELYFRTEQECSSVSEDIPYEQTLFENEKKALAAVENNKKIEYLPEEKKIRMQKGAVVTFDTYFNGFQLKMEEIYSYWRCVRKAGIVRQVQSDSFDKGKDQG